MHNTTDTKTEHNQKTHSLSEWIKIKDSSVRKLAEEVQVAGNSIQRYSKGETLPNVLVARAIAIALGVFEHQIEWGNVKLRREVLKKLYEEPLGCPEDIFLKKWPVAQRGDVMQELEHLAQMSRAAHLAVGWVAVE